MLYAAFAGTKFSFDILFCHNVCAIIFNIVNDVRSFTAKDLCDTGIQGGSLISLTVSSEKQEKGVML